MGTSTVHLTNCGVSVLLLQKFIIQRSFYETKS